MRTRAFSFVLGFGVASVLAGVLTIAVVLPSYGRDKFEWGRNQGIIDAHRALLPKIQTMLGDDYRNADGYQTMFEVKTDAAVVVERNGIKTLRVYTDRP